MQMIQQPVTFSGRQMLEYVPGTVFYDVHLPCYHFQMIHWTQVLGLQSFWIPLQASLHLEKYDFFIKLVSTRQVLH